MTRILTLLFLLVSVSFAIAAAPTMTQPQPRGGQQGSEQLIYIAGQRLGDAQELIVYEPGITVTALKPVNDNQLAVHLKIAGDCRLGEHLFRLRTASGISNAVTFWVGPYPTVEEKEPNSDFAAPQSVPLNCTVRGVVTNEDVDYYAVSLKKGQRLSAEIEGMRLAVAFFDPYIAILDSKRFELAIGDDSTLAMQDGHVSVVAPEDGTYIVQVRETSFGGNDGAQYRLHIGTFPRPKVVYPPGGPINSEVDVTFLGDAAGPLVRKIKTPTQFVEDYRIHAEDQGGKAPTGNRFRLSPYPNVLESGTNINHETATHGTVPCAFNGIISKPKEIDYFRFSAKKGQTFDFTCWARRLGSPLDPMLAIHLVNGGILAANDDSVGPDSRLRYTIPNDGDYVLAISDHLAKGGPDFVYRIEVTPVEPRFDVTIPKVAQFSQERQALAVPRGNRFATLVFVGRVDVGGDVNIVAEKVPEKTTLHTETMPGFMSVVPVVIEAAPDAPLANVLTRFVAQPTDPKVQVPTNYSQLVEWTINGPGQSIYCSSRLSQAAITVTEAVPFKVQIIEPKVPLVQGGSMQLKIVAERAAGFKAPITVFPLYNPPGISSASSVVIPEGQNEVLLPMNAAGNAPLRKWKYVVTAVSDEGKGPMWVSSQVANVEVAAPYIAFTMERTAIEQGKQGQLFCKISVTKEFAGTAKATVVGVPPKIAVPALEFTKDTKELAFPIAVEPTAPAGTHRNIFCQVIITENGEPILHNVGGTELRIDVPLPPKADAPPPPPTAQPNPMQPAPPMPPPMKRLSRLEQLRLEQEEREKAANAKKD